MKQNDIYQSFKKMTAYAFTMLAIALTIPAKAQQVLVWQDDFGGNSLDSATWSYEIGDGCAKGNCGWGNNELEYYTNRPDNVKVDSGNLIITARSENYGGKPFTSGRIKTQGKMSFKYGTLEARIKVPNVANGLWPAYWLLGATGGTWPHNGEIDILEMGFAGALANGNARSTVSSALHWWTENPGGYTGHATYAKDTTAAGLNLDDDYHLYKLVWTPSTITIYIDNSPYYTINITGGNGLDAFQNKQYLLFNLAVGGNYPGIPTAAGVTAPLPGRMMVDYVKLYQDVTQGDELFLAQDDAPSGKFGILTETTPVNDSVTYGTNANLYIWNNLVNTTPASAPYEGTNSWNFTAAAGNWFGFGVANTEQINMVNFANGYLNFRMKTNSPAVFKIGIATDAGEGWVNFTANEYGLVRDGQWHLISVPVSAFTGVDLYTVSQVFMFSGDAPASAFDFSLDDIYYSGGVSANPAPTVAITSPANNALVNTPANITLTVNAADSNGTVSHVVYYDGTTYLGMSGVAPFSFVWANAPQGIHFVTARATDNGNVSTTSAPVKIYIAASGGTPPVVSITSPTASSTYTKPATVNIAVNATDDGVIEKVEFYNGTALIGTDYTAPYTFAWAGVDSGTYTITARAYDNSMQNATSTPVTFTVGGNAITADKYGIYSEDATITTKLTYGADANLYAWNNMTAITGALPYEGSELIAFHANAGDWFGFGVANDIRNLTHFNTGSIKLQVKTSYTGSFKFGIITTAGEYDVNYAASEEKLGLVRDGQWHQVVLPINSFGTVNLNEVSQAFIFAGDAPSAAADFYFDNVYYTIDAPANVPPTVSITNPGNNAHIYQPNPVAFNVTAADADGTISKVEYYNGSVLLGTATTAPFGYNWSNADTGSYTITAKAYDNQNLATTSAPLSIVIKDSASRGPNLCLLKPAFATTNQAANTAVKAVDGLSGTRWESVAADPQSIVVNMGAMYNVDEVKITWEGAYGKNYQIQISPDSLNWTTIKDVTNNTTLVNDHTGLTANGKYLRVLGLVRGTPYGYSIYELEAYGEGNVIVNDPPTVSFTGPANNASYMAPASIPLTATAADDDGTIIKVEFYNGSTLLGTSLTAPYNFTWANAPQGNYVIKAKAYDNQGFSTFSSPLNIVVTADTLGPNLCLNKTAAASTGVASFAVDGNSGTRWESAFADPQWITVDLGSSYSINSVNITWETAMAAAYKIEISADSVTWNMLQNVTNNTTTTNNFTGLSGTGRYLRVTGTQRATIYGYSIWELKAYGIAASGIPLSMSVTDLQASVLNRQVNVEWKALSESGMKNYAVEKSENGITFEQMNVIDAQNKQSIQSYMAIDFNPNKGINYYRIKTVSDAGLVSYSDIVKADCQQSGTREFLVYPNPVKGNKATLDMSGIAPSDYKLQVYNVAGKKIWQQSLIVSKSNGTQTLHLPETLTSGTYYFILEDANAHKYQQKVVLE